LKKVNLKDETLQIMAEEIHRGGCIRANEVTSAIGSLLLIETSRVNTVLLTASEEGTAGGALTQLEFQREMASVSETLASEVRRSILIAGDIPISHCRHKTNLKDAL
jgi:Zn finger protein HypA/HybF involved in hydrogenase expression